MRSLKADKYIYYYKSVLTPNCRPWELDFVANWNGALWIYSGYLRNIIQIIFGSQNPCKKSWSKRGKGVGRRRAIKEGKGVSLESLVLDQACSNFRLQFCRCLKKKTVLKNKFKDCIAKTKRWLNLNWRNSFVTLVNLKGL